MKKNASIPQITCTHQSIRNILSNGGMVKFDVNGHITCPDCNGELDKETMNQIVHELEQERLLKGAEKKEALAIQFKIINNQVAIMFSQKVATLFMSREQALQFTDDIIKCVEQINKIDSKKIIVN